MNDTDIHVIVPDLVSVEKKNDINCNKDNYDDMKEEHNDIVHETTEIVNDDISMSVSGSEVTFLHNNPYAILSNNDDEETDVDNIIIESTVDGVWSEKTDAHAPNVKKNSSKISNENKKKKPTKVLFKSKNCIGERKEKNNKTKSKKTEKSTNGNNTIDNSIGEKEDIGDLKSRGKNIDNELKKGKLDIHQGDLHYMNELVNQKAFITKNILKEKKKLHEITLTYDKVLRILETTNDTETLNNCEGKLCALYNEFIDYYIINVSRESVS